MIEAERRLDTRFAGRQSGSSYFRSSRTVMHSVVAGLAGIVREARHGQECDPVVPLVIRRPATTGSRNWTSSSYHRTISLRWLVFKVRPQIAIDCCPSIAAPSRCAPLADPQSRSIIDLRGDGLRFLTRYDQRQRQFRTLRSRRTSSFTVRRQAKNIPEDIVIAIKTQRAARKRKKASGPDFEPFPSILISLPNRAACS